MGAVRPARMHDPTCARGQGRADATEPAGGGGLFAGAPTWLVPPTLSIKVYLDNDTLHKSALLNYARV